MNELPKHFSIDDIPWDAPNHDGTRSATLVGTRDAGVMFSYAFFIPAGVFDAPHSHPADAHLHVARGVLRLGYGREFDRTTAEGYPVGTFLYVPRDVVHFDGALEDTIIIGTATGPWSTDHASEVMPT